MEIVYVSDENYLRLVEISADYETKHDYDTEEKIVRDLAKRGVLTIN